MLETNYQNRKKMQQANTIACLGVFILVPYSTPKIVAEFLNRSISATYKLLARLERESLICSREIPTLKIRVWSITLQGYHFYTSNLRIDNPPYREPRLNQISPLTINHELTVQWAHTRAQKAQFTNWQYGHALTGKLLKRPDAIARSPKQGLWAIEIELFRKSKKRIRVIIGQYLQSVAQGKYDRIAYITADENSAWSMRRLFGSISHVTINNTQYALEPKHHNKFLFFSLDNWPHKPEKSL